MKERFGITEFKSGQEEAVDAAISGRDVLCFMPTGHGKSICYQIPAILADGVTLVITPLISLMDDQVRELSNIGLPSVAIHANANKEHVHMMLSKASTKLIYLSPERLSQKEFILFIAKRKISRIVIDEAHCISVWGDGFRPEYQRIVIFISELRKLRQSKIPISAFTATANYRIIKDIIEYAGIQKRYAYFYKGEVIRENISLSFRRSDSKNDDLIKLLNSNRYEPTVIYVNTIKFCETISKHLRSNGIEHRIFHSKLSPSNKADSLNSFVNNQTDIIVATSAFGMGINKSNIRHVIHMQIPDSVEMYYQQVGRSGRDGMSASAILLYDNKDKPLNRFMIQSSYPKSTHIWAIISSLECLSEDGRVDAHVDDILLKSPLKVTPNELKGVIKLLKSEGMIIEYSDNFSEYYRLELVNFRAPLNIDSIDYKRRQAMEDFDELLSIANSSLCRNFLIDDYFSSRPLEYKSCNNCDNCLTTAINNPEHIITRDYLSVIKKDIKLLPIFSKEDLLLHWMGYREIRSGTMSFAMNSSLNYEQSLAAFKTLVSFGFFIKVNESYIVNEHAFKNEALIKLMIIKDNFNIKATDNFTVLSKLRQALSENEGVSENKIMTDYQIIKICTLSTLRKEDLIKIVGTNMANIIHEIISDGACNLLSATH